MHLGQRHDQGELVVLHVELEQVPPPNDLEAGQHNAPEVHMGDEHIAGDLADVVEEGEVQVLVLQPGQLQVAVNVGAVRVAGKRKSIITIITVCPGSSDPFYVVTYYIKWVTTHKDTQ